MTTSAGNLEFLLCWSTVGCSESTHRDWVERGYRSPTWWIRWVCSL